MNEAEAQRVAMLAMLKTVWSLLDDRTLKGRYADSLHDTIARLIDEAEGRTRTPDQGTAHRQHEEQAPCWNCNGTGAVTGWPDTPFEQCEVCGGNGVAPDAPQQRGREAHDL